MSFRLLIDECLHPGLVALAKERSIAADYGPHLGKTGWQDHSLVSFAIDNDYIIVTNNRRDFLKLYMQQSLHGGLVILVPRLVRSRMDRLFALALDAIAAMQDDTVNRVIEVLEDGSVHIRVWNADSHDLGHVANPRWPSS